jgi:endonuclease-8
MEGPSLRLAAEQLAPLVGQVIQEVHGNTKIEKERFLHEKIHLIFSYGKYLIFQFEHFALKVHFLLFGSFEATIQEKKVTGDYPRPIRTPRLAFELNIGHIELYNCSVKIIENDDLKNDCDFTIDVMASDWDEKKALKQLKAQSDEEIADVLLDQSIFLGVGNIIKNEVLFLAHISPLTKVKELSAKQLKNIVTLTRSYVFQFYEWRKQFELKKHYQVYRQHYCKVCGTKVIRKKTGHRNRVSYICPHCQS